MAKSLIFIHAGNLIVPGTDVYTMVEMAWANGVNVYQYLTYLLEKCPTSQTPDEDLAKLAPWDPEVKRITGECSKALQAE